MTAELRLEWLPRTTELNISLNPESARTVADGLRNGHLIAEANTNFDPYPYDMTLNRIRIRTEGDGKVKLRVNEQEGTLEISGGIDYLNNLASDFEEITEVRNPWDVHTHVEYFDNHYFLADATVSLIITGLRQA